MSTFHFSPSAYGPVLSGLLALPRLAELGPGSPVKAVEVGLRRFDPRSDLGLPITNVNASRACQAGLWLFFDYLNESHEVSQELETPEGSYWHAIMHRREPDAANSKYWWRRVGSHPVIERLISETPALGYNYTNPFDFVDFCEQHRGRNTPDETLAKQVQLLEWQLLFDQCYIKATA